MKTRTPNRFGRKCLCVCCAVSCILFQLMFCGLIYLYVCYTLWMVPDYVFSMEAHEIISYCHEKNAATECSVARLGLLSVLCLALHLALICFIALRRPGAGASAEPAGKEG